MKLRDLTASELDLVWCATRGGMRAVVASSLFLAAYDALERRYTVAGQELQFVAVVALVWLGMEATHRLIAEACQRAIDRAKGAERRYRERMAELRGGEE